MSADEGNAAEERIRQLFKKMSPNELKSNVKIGRRGKEGELEGEIDLVCVFGDDAFVIEVSENAQEDARRRKRKHLRDWNKEDLAEDVARELGWQHTKPICLVYVDLSKKVEEKLPNSKDMLIMYENHVERLEDAPGEEARKLFLMWVCP